MVRTGSTDAFETRENGIRLPVPAHLWAHLEIVISAFWVRCSTGAAFAPQTCRRGGRDVRAPRRAMLSDAVPEVEPRRNLQAY